MPQHSTVIPTFSFLDIRIPEEFSCAIILNEYRRDVLENLFEIFSSENSFFFKENGEYKIKKDWDIDSIICDSDVIIVIFEDQNLCFCQPADGFYVLIFDNEFKDLANSNFDFDIYSEPIDFEINFLRENNKIEFANKFEYLKSRF